MITDKGRVILNHAMAVGKEVIDQLTLSIAENDAVQPEKYPFFNESGRHYLKNQGVTFN